MCKFSMSVWTRNFMINLTPFLVRLTSLDCSTLICATRKIHMQYDILVTAKQLFILIVNFKMLFNFKMLLLFSPITVHLILGRFHIHLHILKGSMCAQPLLSFKSDSRPAMRCLKVSFTMQTCEFYHDFCSR